MDRILQISLFIFTGITAVLGVSGGTTNTVATPIHSSIILYIVGAAAAFTGILQSIIKYLDLPKRIHSEKEAIKKLSNLMSQIESVLHLEIEDRPGAKTFLTSVLDTFRKYQDTGDILQEEVHSWKLRIRKVEDITALTVQQLQQQRKGSVASGSDGPSWSNFKIVDEERDERPEHYQKPSRDIAIEIKNETKKKLSESKSEPKDKLPV
jgi:hypothetical protein